MVGRVQIWHLLSLWAEAAEPISHELNSVYDKRHVWDEMRQGWPLED